jgi:PhnB protein
LFAKATGEGAKTKMPPPDMFWGDRFAAIVDPSGHEWPMATHKEDVAPDEMMKRMQRAT